MRRSLKRLLISTEMTSRPKTLATYARLFARAVDERGVLRAIWYWRQFLAIALGGTAVYFMPTDSNGLWARHDLAVMVMTGVLTFNGILLAVGWGAFGKIYDLIAEPKFSSFLRRQNILDAHLMFVAVVHFSLASAALISFAALLCILLPVPLWVNQALFGAMIAASVNAIFEAFRATGMMNDLIWDVAHWNEAGQGQPNLRPVENGK